MFHTSFFKPSFNAFILMAGLRLYSACIVHIQAGFFDRHKKPLIFQTDHSKQTIPKSKCYLQIC